MLVKILYSVLVFEFGVFCFMLLYPEKFAVIIVLTRFYFLVLSAYVYFYSFGKPSTVTLSTNGEIIKQIFIGKD